MERWAASFPAGGGNLFSDPLYRCSSSSIMPARSAYSAFEYSEIQQWLEEPQDESHLPDLLGIASSPTSDHGMTVQTCTYVPQEIKKVRERTSPMPYTVLPEQEEAPTTTVLGGERGREEEDEEKEGDSREIAGLTCPRPCYRREDGDALDLIAKRGSGMRGSRRRGTWKRGPGFFNHFLNSPCFWGLCSSKGEKRGHRENNEPWTPKEVKLLVDGISEIGVGRWTELKDGWFSDSNLDSGPVRTAVHLKTAFEVYSACEYSEIQPLLEEPQNESHLPDLLGIASSLTSDHDMTIQTCLLPCYLGGERGGKEKDEEQEDRREGSGSTCPQPCYLRRRPVRTTTPREEGGLTSSIVDLQERACSTRGSRKRGTWKSGIGFLTHFLNTPYFQGFCSASKSEKEQHRKGSKSKKRGHRKANEHWEPEEVKLLVDGVSKLGVGRWAKLKNKCFPNSDSDIVRTPMNLKDKWRNLLKAYVVKPTTKKKGKNAHLDKELINKIKMLAARHRYPK